MRLNKEESRIVIVGGGLAGLSVAVALEKAGFHHISLFERDLSFEQQKEGYGLTLTYNPKGPLASLGVLEQVAQRDCPSRSHYLFRVRIRDWAGILRTLFELTHFFGLWS